jgi:hypothetical protein
VKNITNSEMGRPEEAVVELKFLHSFDNIVGGKQLQWRCSVPRLDSHQKYLQIKMYLKK